MQPQDKITDQGPAHDYFSCIPHIIARCASISPSELKLYLYLKSITGEQGVCWKSTKTIAAETGMAAGTISDAKKRLAEPRADLGGRALITITPVSRERGGSASHYIKIVDLWPENMAAMATVKQMSKSEPVKSEAATYGSTYQNPNVQVQILDTAGSESETKKNPSEEEPPEEEGEALEAYASKAAADRPQPGRPELTRETSDALRLVPEDPPAPKPARRTRPESAPRKNDFDTKVPIELFRDGYAAEFGEAPDMTNRGHIHALIQRYGRCGHDRFVQVLEAYLRSSDSWAVQSGHDLATFIKGTNDRWLRGGQRAAGAVDPERKVMQDQAEGMLRRMEERRGMWGNA